MKSNKLLFSLCLLFFGSQLVLGQQVKPGKKPAYQTEQEKAMRNLKTTEAFYKAAQYKTVPKGMILPGEYEESQCVAISWSFDYDAQSNPTGADVTSEFALISARLADAIQKECPVYIRVLYAKDTVPIKNMMQTLGTPLVNYKFMIAVGDDWWTRDYGPMAFYSGNLDSIGFVDMKYYPGRDNDDIFPAKLAQVMGYENYITQIEAEGGNLMTDGYGKLFFSDVIQTNNASANAHPGGWVATQTLDTLKNIFNTPELSSLKSLNCDGGTGHIDLYVKLIDEQTIIASQYPSAITATDRKIIEDNVQYLTGLKSTYNRPFRIFRIEHPTDDDGNHTLVTCAQIDGDARNFINGLTVNKSFIYPSYYDGTTGNAVQHRNIIAKYKRLFPGYKIVPIDSRAVSPLGGAIHCITMQIPSENPVRIWHPTVDGLVLPLPKYHIIVKASNKSGIATAKCVWRKNAGTWNTENLTDSSGYFIGDISNVNLTGIDTVEYYVSATSNNGKTAYKPIAAMDGGYFTMRTNYINGISEPKFENLDHLFNAYPNPAKESVTLSFKLTQMNDASLQIFDIYGRLVFQREFNKLPEGMYTSEVNTCGMAAGMYVYQLSINQQPVMSKRLILE